MTGRWHPYLAVGIAAALVCLLALSVLAQSPTPGPTTGSGTIIAPGDPRSDGQGPGLVGSPIVIALGILGLGLLTAALTAVAVHVSRRVAGRDDP